MCTFVSVLETSWTRAAAVLEVVSIWTRICSMLVAASCWNGCCGGCCCCCCCCGLIRTRSVEGRRTCVAMYFPPSGLFFLACGNRRGDPFSLGPKRARSVSVQNEDKGGSDVKGSFGGNQKKNAPLQHSQTQTQRKGRGAATYTTTTTTTPTSRGSGEIT